MTPTPIKRPWLSYWGLSMGLRYLQCVRNGDTTIEATDVQRLLQLLRGTIWGAVGSSKVTRFAEWLLEITQTSSVRPFITGLWLKIVVRPWLWNSAYIDWKQLGSHCLQNATTLLWYVADKWLNFVFVFFANFILSFYNRKVLLTSSIPQECPFDFFMMKLSSQMVILLISTIFCISIDCDAPVRYHRGEAMYISLIDFQWTSTETKEFSIV